MVSLKDIRNIYFIGIGGIGMSAIARYFLSRNVKVSGYDKTPTALSLQLEAEGAAITYADEVNLLDKGAQLVVFTPAIPATHQQLNWYRNNHYEVVKRSDVLQIITANTFNICIAGTHGKTTISTMVGHLLRSSGYGCNAFLGGISVNYQTNFWSSANNVCVVEADEYDRSFLKLSPDMAVISAMDADHLDIYGTAANMEEAFVAFAHRIKPNGLLIRKAVLQQLNSVPTIQQYTYQLGKESVDADQLATAPGRVNIYATNMQVVDGGYFFDAHINDHIISEVRMMVGGMHNVENMLAAMTIAHKLGIQDSDIKEAVASYTGVRRRFEYLLRTTKTNGLPVVAIDDYAHHPEELKALLNSVRQLFPEMPVTIVFQPHLYTRTRDLAAEFAKVLSMADQVLLLPIYPARELPIEGISSSTIASHMAADKVEMVTKESLLSWIAAHQPSLFITAGAGDIDTLLPEIKKTLMHA